MQALTECIHRHGLVVDSAVLPNVFDTIPASAATFVRVPLAKLTSETVKWLRKNGKACYIPGEPISRYYIDYVHYARYVELGRLPAEYGDAVLLWAIARCFRLRLVVFRVNEDGSAKLECYRHHMCGDVWDGKFNEFTVPLGVVGPGQYVRLARVV